MSASVVSTSSRTPSHRYNDDEWQMRLDLAACYHLAHRFGFSDIIWNHITARVPGNDDHILINRFGLRYDEITASNLLKIDLDGKPVDDEGETNITGFVIHSAIHAARDDVVCVMHSHSQGGLCLSVMEEGLLPMTQDGLSFYKRVSYHDYQGLSTDINERESLAADLGANDVMIMRNHGLLTVGGTVGAAFIRMYYLERACRAQMQVLASGQKYRLPSPEMCERAAQQFGSFAAGEHEWPALLRLLDQENAPYRR